MKRSDDNWRGVLAALDLDPERVLLDVRKAAGIASESQLNNAAEAFTQCIAQITVKSAISLDSEAFWSWFSTCQISAIGDRTLLQATLDGDNTMVTNWLGHWESGGYA